MYVDRSRLFTRLLMVLCLSIWCFVAFEVASFAAIYVYNTSAPPNPGDFYKHSESSYYKFGPVYIEWRNTDTTAQTGFQITGDKYYWTGIKNGIYAEWIRYIYIYPTTKALYDEHYNIWADTDNDSIRDKYDPCKETPDSTIQSTVVSDHCTGEWLRFTSFGSCYDPSSGSSYGSKTYYNRKYTEAEAKQKIQQAKDNGCYSMAPKSFTASSYMQWWDTLDENYNSTVIPSESANPNDGITDANIVNMGNSTFVPSETSDDPDMNKILNQIDRLQKAVQSSAQDIVSAVGSGADKVVAGLKGLGGTDHGVASAIGSAAGTAHADAQALLEAINGLGDSLGNSNSSGEGNSSNAFIALTKEELQDENNRLYSTENGVGFETSAVGFSGSLLSHIQTWTNTLKNHVLGILPISTVSTVNPTPCLSYNGNIVDARGKTYVLTDYCFDDWGPSLSMIGNMLLAVFSIICLFSVFKMA